MPDDHPHQVTALVEEGRVVALRIDGETYESAEAIAAVPRIAGLGLLGFAALLLLETPVSFGVRLVVASPVLLLAALALWRSRQISRLRFH